MSDCPFQFQLSAFHDGELDGTTAQGFEAHLPGCGACSSELAELEEMSRLFSAKAGATMLPLEMARLHLNLEQSTCNQPAESDFLRTAGLLSALAASILIISGVWLAEFPSRPAATLSPGVAVVPASDFSGNPASLPAWERTALTLQVEPSPAVQLPGSDSQIDQSGLADASAAGDHSTDAQVADWMLAGLSDGVNAGGSHANP